MTGIQAVRAEEPFALASAPLSAPAAAPGRERRIHEGDRNPGVVSPPLDKVLEVVKRSVAPGEREGGARLLSPGKTCAGEVFKFDAALELPGHLYNLACDPPVQVAPDTAFAIPFSPALFALPGAAALLPVIGVTRELTEHHHAPARRVGHDGEMIGGVQVDPDPVTGRGIIRKNRDHPSNCETSS